MPSITSRVRDAAPRSRELHQILSQTRCARQSLEDQKQYIAALDGMLRQVQREVKNLAQTTKSERQMFQSYRRNLAKRAVTWATGEENTCIRTMEQKFLRAQQQELHAQRDEHDLQEQRVALLAVQHSLEDEVRRRVHARNDHEALLDYVFQDPTPEFPEHDDLKQNAEVALRSYHDSTEKLESEQKLLALLSHARDRTRHALYKIDTMQVTLDVSALKVVRRALDQAEVLVTRARGISCRMAVAWPEDGIVWLVGSLPTIVVLPRVSILYCVRICRGDVLEVLDALDEQFKMAKSRCYDLKRDTNEKLQLMNAARTRLHSVRRRIFAGILDESILLPAAGEAEEASCDDPPPSYSSLFGSSSYSYS